ncbi:helix-turn-helix domain-containing protein [Pseudomonas gingeri]|uniref:transcriptional regulator n=1 Tax=Pseudomonas gingeri TaxID=117681 RepID=UPI0015A2D2C8|nr:YdaS family helix-turn-helix protein [Pseudomonas gingeri]NWA25487.1 helix-turn-helix domain-containing protein [Pseudomonas gingeri]
MNLREFLKPLEGGSVAAFAKACETSPGQLKQVAYGNRRPSASLAINVERESSGQVTCEELRPDIDWAYVRGTNPGSLKAADPCSQYPAFRS